MTIRDAGRAAQALTFYRRHAAGDFFELLTAGHLVLDYGEQLFEFDGQ